LTKGKFGSSKPKVSGEGRKHLQVQPANGKRTCTCPRGGVAGEKEGNTKGLTSPTPEPKKKKKRFASAQGESHLSLQCSRLKEIGEPKEKTGREQGIFILFARGNVPRRAGSWRRKTNQTIRGAKRRGDKFDRDRKKLALSIRKDGKEPVNCDGEGEEKRDPSTFKRLTRTRKVPF